MRENKGIVAVKWDTPLNPSKAVYFCRLTMEESLAIVVVLKQITLDDVCFTKL
jgi:hypothetical protein